MAFGSEIRFKIGGDTSALSKSFVAAQSIAATAGKQIERKLGMKDAFKGLMQGIGIGSVDAISDLIVRPFEHAASRAKAMVSLTKELLGITRHEMGAIGGPTREFQVQIQEVNELSGDIQKQRQLIAGLNANPLNFVSPQGMAEIKEAEAGLDELIKRHAELASQVKVAAVMDGRKLASVQAQQQLENQLAANQLNHSAKAYDFDVKLMALRREYEKLKKQGALPSTLQSNLAEQQAVQNQQKIFQQSMREKTEDIKAAGLAAETQAGIELRQDGELAKGLAKLNALRKEYDVLINRNATSAEKEANKSAQRLQDIENEIAKRKAREAERGAQVGNGQALAGNRRTFPNGQPRPRSEAERLADRGANSLRQAEDAIRTGRSPAFVARLTASAEKDFKTVGARVEQATSAVDKDTGIKSELILANKTLEDIRKNLAPVKLK